jgi:hypothetical protein
MVELYQEVSDDNGARGPQRWGKVALAVGAACALLLVGFATGSHFLSSPAFSKVAAPIGLSQITVIPPREECAKTNTNCIAQGCCKITGYNCYEVRSGYAKCMKSCTPGQDGDCFMHSHSQPSKKSGVTNTANTLFCFAFYTADTGNTKPSLELDLVRTQLFLGAGIFGCEEYRVYSDAEEWLSPAPKEVRTIKVSETTDLPFHYEKRKKSGTWVNANMFIATWKMIKDEGAWSKWDWTVKVDLDAIFIPIRLRQYLANTEVTNNGIYFENCKYVNYGFFGSLAVVSHDAAATYMANLDDCKAALNYMGHEKTSGNQAWGEDLFQQRCMDLHGVDKVAAYDITTDASCAAWRPEGEKKNGKWKPDCAVVRTPGIHHFKKPKDYFECLKATQGNM